MTDRRWVVDTNTVVSALLFEHSTPGRAFSHARATGVLLQSEATKMELARVLERDKFDTYVQRDTRREFLAALFDEAEEVEVDVDIQACRDSDDDKFLELAVSGGADAIISGDDDLLVLGQHAGIPIWTADTFLKRVTDSS
jgi:putative PIN family toxin of toxin-antitoxin system